MSTTPLHKRLTGAQWAMLTSRTVRIAVTAEGKLRVTDRRERSATGRSPRQAIEALGR